MAYALTSKSQVTVPKHIRKALNVGPGQEIDYVIEPDGQVVIVPSRPVSSQPGYGQQPVSGYGRDRYSQAPY